jgi:hypothetical protein
MSLTGAPPLLDELMPQPDVRERFATIVRAPAPLVLDTACHFDLQSMWLVRIIFRMRGVLMRTPAASERTRQGILAETLGLGWRLLHRDERSVIVGARCQPWRGDVVFTSIPPDEFARYDRPEQVKILWTLEVDALGPAETRFSHETRAAATDDGARRRFHRYWRWARFGILAIRYLMMPAVRREAEARWQGTRRDGHARLG